MLPKLLPMLDPASLSRQTAVASMNPTGMIVVSPILSWRGELPPLSAATGCCGGAAGKGLEDDLDGAVGGNMGTEEAISSRFCTGAAAGAPPATIIAVTFSRIFFCAS